MYIILNRANLVVCATTAARLVTQLPNGNMALAQGWNATAIYAADNDSFYPLDANGGIDTYRLVEVETIPAEVVPGYWYYTGEFFTTPEREAELAAVIAQKDAVRVSSISFVVMAEAGQIDDVTATENINQFTEWVFPAAYEVGNIRRYKGKLYRCLQAHKSQEDWNPAAAVSLWVGVGDPAVEWPEWAQPIGSHDAYAQGDKVSHKGEHWVSSVGGNVWEPGVYGWEKQAAAKK